MNVKTSIKIFMFIPIRVLSLVNNINIVPVNNNKSVLLKLQKNKNLNAPQSLKVFKLL